MDIFVGKNIRKYYPLGGRGILERVFLKDHNFVKALDGVSINIIKGETLAVIGESGCGKTTLAKIIATIEKPSEGELYFMGNDVFKNVELVRRNIGMVLQNPLSSLNPRMTVEEIITEVSKNTNRTKELLEVVGLTYDYVKDKYPNELSGGQVQRVSIAKALAKNPTLLILDEPTSALDASIQAQILNLLLDLRRELNMTYLFITHNIVVANYISDRMIVLYAGKVVEEGKNDEILERPFHPYTQHLVSSIPKLYRKELSPPLGEPPSLINPPKGCRFHPRCPYVMDVCKLEEPPIVKENDRIVSCWLYYKR